MKRPWRSMVTLYYRLAGRFWQWRLMPHDGPTYIELGSPWRDGLKVPSHSRHCESIQRRYLRAGGGIGDAVSYLYLGECVGFGDLLDEWQEAEHEYAAAGFRTLPIEVLSRFGGYGQLPEDVGRIRSIDEKAVYHAALYRKHFYGKPVPMDVESRDGGVVTGHWLPPSTGDMEGGDG